MFDVVVPDWNFWIGDKAIGFETINVSHMGFIFVDFLDVVLDCSCGIGCVLIFLLMAESNSS